NEDDLAMLGCVDQLLHFGAYSFVGLRGSLAQRMHPSVNVGIVLRIKAADRLNHLPRFLRRGRVIEIYKWPSKKLLFKDGEVLSNPCNIQWRRTAILRG